MSMPSDFESIYVYIFFIFLIYRACCASFTSVLCTIQWTVCSCGINGIQCDVKSIVTDLCCRMRQWNWQRRPHDAWQRLPNTVEASMATMAMCHSMVLHCWQSMHCLCTDCATNRKIRSYSMMLDANWWVFCCCLQLMWRLVHVAIHCSAVSLHCDSPCWDRRHTSIRDWWMDRVFVRGRATKIDCRMTIHCPAVWATDPTTNHLTNATRKEIEEL